VRGIALWRNDSCLVLACALAVACKEPAPATRTQPSVSAPVASSRAPPQPRPARDAPTDPRSLGASDRPRVVLMTAKWCQWCRALEHEVLPDPKVKRLLAERYQLLEVDVDERPAWLDLPGVEGLPALVFFDPKGGHVLTRSGYRKVPDMISLLDVVADRIERGELEPYPERPAGPKLAARGIDREGAAAALRRFESKIFIKVNSNDGGFRSPARHPCPDLLRELQAWIDFGGAPERVGEWVKLTLDGALRGGSPRQRGKALDDMSFDATELVELSRRGPDAGQRWRAGLDLLADQDPWLGIQDPIDHGVFRYAAGPGWYNPHFERRAADNLAWVVLLRARHRSADSAALLHFVEATFDDRGLLNAVQRADPYYYRLTRGERSRVPPPPVERLRSLLIQARGARADPKRCGLLLRVRSDRWPREIWTDESEDEASADATPDAVGELLLALAECPGAKYRERALALGNTVASVWGKAPPSRSTKPERLERLAAGLCAAQHDSCERALASVSELPLELDFAPPLVALAQRAK
jgi:hypothetical protein